MVSDATLEPGARPRHVGCLLHARPPVRLCCVVGGGCGGFGGGGGAGGGGGGVTACSACSWLLLPCPLRLIPRASSALLTAHCSLSAGHYLTRKL
jgi:hypothetical protein